MTIHGLPPAHALHALWRGDRLALWAERPEPGPATPPEEAPEQAHLVEPGHPVELPHPFACPAPSLRTVLEATTPAVRWLATGAEAGRAVLRLPSTAVPVGSPELTGPAAERDHDARDVVLRPWAVETLEFAPSLAAQLLGELYDPYPWRSMLVADDVELHFGASVRWLVAVHDHAWRAVRQGRVVPALVTAGGRPHARWQPLPDAAAGRELDALAAAAPPSALAEVGGTAAVEGLLGRVVAALADAEVRIATESVRPLSLPGRDPSPSPSAASRTRRAWARALTSPTGEVTGADGAALVELGRSLTRWHRSSARPPREIEVSFRLVEPSGASPYDSMGWNTDEHWAVEFAVRSAAEPAIAVDTADLFAGGPALAAFTRTVPGVEAAVLDELDRAARCWPPLRDALRDSRPARLRVDRAGATAFLADGAPALEEAGFGVLLPSWWRRRPALGLRMTARAADPGVVQTTSLLDRDAVVGVDWEAALGDVRLSRDELEQLAAATVPLVRLRGQWLVADRADISAALAFLRRAGEGTITAGEVLRTGLAALPVAGGLPVVGVEAEGALGDLLAGRPPVAAPRLPPGFGDAFHAVLRPYQVRGLAWLTALEGLGLGAVLADDMGLGKTVQTLALLVADRLASDRLASDRLASDRLAATAPPPGTAPEGEAAPDGARTTLLVCPMSLVGNWQHEAARFAPGLRVAVHHGAGRRTAGLAAVAAASDLVITTYAVALRDVEELGRVRWHRLVVDEAHQIKNRSAAQSRAVRSLPARHRLALTGTPVENRLADLHAVLDLVNPRLFGSAESFRERYSVPVERHGDELAAADLRRRTRPLVLRRLKTDPAVVADLPDKVEMTVHCTLTVEQAALYQAVVRDVLKRVEGRRGIERRGVVLASLSKLKQVCNHPAQFLRDGSRIDGRSGKVARLEEILEEVVAAGERALCFTQFAAFGALLQPYLARRLDREVLFLHGGLPRAERERLVGRFQSEGRSGDGPGGAGPAGTGPAGSGAAGPAVFLLSLTAGGTGLNLTAANHVIHLDRWWNPAVEDQATDRAFRIGQRKDVQVRRLVCAGTIEERIDEIMAGKRALAQAAVTSGEGWLADLPVDELADLLALDDVAVEGEA